MSPGLKKGLLLGAALVLAVAIGLHAGVHDHHLDDPEWVTHWWNTTPVLKDVWFLLMGFGGCAVIVYGSKWLGHAWLQRPEGYYGEDPPDEEDAGEGEPHE
ncbi:MAG: hypothetical protein P1V51_03255 [Deltaproteobacteria bacterium]|nr:hypothetical protein [Deltaproteobacteria bacterium]